MNTRFSRAYTCAFLVCCALTLAAGPKAAVGGPVTPSFDPANFTPSAPIDNAYFPLTPGTLFTTTATVTDPDTGQKSTQVDKMFVTSKTEQIGGVSARVVSDRVFTDGLLSEETTDFYAQDKSGNVWYLGERTAQFERDDAGKIINTDTTGTWITGIHGAMPGFIMPVDHTVGFFYREEFAPLDQAVDQAEIVANDLTLDTKLGHFTHVLKTRNTSDIEPGVVEQKFYAPGFGVVLEEELAKDGSVANRFPLGNVTHPSAIPLPPAVWSGLSALVLASAVTCRGRLSRARS